MRAARPSPPNLYRRAPCHQNHDAPPPWAARAEEHGLRFESSADHAGLQLVDTVAYVIRKAILAHADPILIASGDDLVLLHKGRRTEVKVMPDFYHDLTTIAHAPTFRRGSLQVADEIA